MARARYTDADVADVLDQARELMNNKGEHWIKGSLRVTKLFLRPDGVKREKCYCSYGAICAVTIGKPGLRRRAVAALNREIVGWKSENTIHITHFNDASYTTWANVSKKFKAAARALRKSS